jgi:glucose-6-phosphate 1-dehydrogenase
MIRTLLLLGATGDLARRYVLPALGSLEQTGRLPVGFRVVGGARTAFDDEGFRNLAGNALPADQLTYHPVDLDDPSSLAAALGDRAQEPVAAYLALPPGVFATTIESLRTAGLAAGSRIVVEKPFGTDLESARALNALLAQTGAEAYRVDHVLGMQTTRNLVEMRRRNQVLERLWNGDAIGQVEILWEETLALEDRAGYYDHAGALKDVLQNHVLQLLALAAMDMPVDDADLHEQKLNVLRAARVIPNSRRARYIGGTLADGREVPAYADEEGVDPGRCTETFAEVVLGVESPRWSGTRFVLRAGKALARRRKLVLLRFRGGGELELGIDGPKDVMLRLAGDGGEVLKLRAPEPSNVMSPYAHVLLDVLSGTSALSVAGEEAEEAWRVVAPVVSAWRTAEVELDEYAAGSPGPS